MPVASEDKEHRDLARALSVLIGPPGRLSSLGVMWMSLEHRNAASVAEGARRKSCGVVSGIPDLCIKISFLTYWIELKKIGGKPSKAQTAMHQTLRELGDYVAICEGSRAALDQIVRWGIPMRGKVLT